MGKGPETHQLLPSSAAAMGFASAHAPLNLASQAIMGQLF